MKMYMTIGEGAQSLRGTVPTVRWLRQEGRFAPAIKVGRRVLWDEKALTAWLEGNKEAPGRGVSNGRGRRNAKSVTGRVSRRMAGRSLPGCSTASLTVLAGVQAGDRLAQGPTRHGGNRRRYGNTRHSPGRAGPGLCPSPRAGALAASLWSSFSLA